jgi:glycosyltransferase involved in cell wall biosynthesis
VAGTKAVYVPNAVELFPSEQVATWRELWRARLGLGPDSVLVMGVGRLAPQKNFARFIDVVAGVAKQARLQAVIVGEDFGCLADLKSRAARHSLEKTIRFLGKVPDARELICAADIFLLTSDHEGMPNVVLEAMSAGVPCVSTNVNGLGDLVRHGTNGFVADGSVDTLAGYAAQLVADPDLRRLIGTNARAAIERVHQPSHVASRLWDLCSA